jgi:cyclase
MTLFSRRQVLHAGVQLAGAASLTMLPSAWAANASITSTELAPGLFLLQGAGCNVVALKGKDGSLLVDGGLAANSKSLLQAVTKATSNTRVAKLINTHWHPEQTGLNETVGRAGGEIIAHENTRLYLGRSVLSTCYQGSYGPLPINARPTKTTRTKETLQFNDQSIEYGYLPAAHTDGDLYVHFPNSNVLVGGGPVLSERWPILDIRNGGWTGGLVRAHEALAAIVKPDTKVVPAEGKLITGADIIRHRDMYQALFKQLFMYLNKGFGPSDVVAERPLKAHEAEFGDPTQFLIGAYRSILMAYVPD